MISSSRLGTVGAALALALLPAGVTASSAFADTTTPAFTLTQTSTGFDLSVLGTGAIVAYTVQPDGSVEAVDSTADAVAVDLPASAPATTGSDAQGSTQTDATETPDPTETPDATETPDPTETPDATETETPDPQSSDASSTDTQSSDTQSTDTQSTDAGSTDGSDGSGD